MARPTALAAALAAILATGCMRARNTPEEPYVTEVEIRGARAIDPDVIRSRIATQPSDRFAWQEARILDPDALVVDRKRIEALYRTRGYYDARVTDARAVPGVPGRVKVVFEVDEGTPVRVTRVEVTGLEDVLAVPDVAEQLDPLPLREGEVFTEGDYDATRGLLATTLRNNGWATAEVTQRARVFPSEHAAEVTYEVKAGRRWKFGAIQPIGTRSVPRDRIRRQAAIEIATGEWWDESKLPKAQARVFGLGVFGGVRLLRGSPDERGGSIPIIVSVREAPFRTIRAGPRAGLESNVRVDVSAMAGYTNRNFLGDLRRLQLDLRAGYAWLVVTERQKQGPVALASVEFSQPGAFGPRIDGFARLEVERGLEQAYDYWAERIRVGVPLRLAPRWTLVPSYNLEVYQLSNVLTTFDPERPTSGGSVLQNCVRSAAGTSGVCLLSYLEQRIGWDGRDDPINTRRGFYFLVAVQEGANLGGYGYRYLRVLPEARTYLALGPDVVLAARARVGALVPVKESGAPPIVARFQAGGAQSMRGYRTGRLSPMELIDGDWVPVGGNGLFDGSLELRFGLSGSWGGALFVDAANVSRPSAVPTAWRTALDPVTLQWATGLGLRYRTPFGPIRLDAGFRVPTDYAAGVRWADRFPGVPSVENPAPGGPTFHRENWFAIHLSLGEAF